MPNQFIPILTQYRIVPPGTAKDEKPRRFISATNNRLVLLKAKFVDQSKVVIDPVPEAVA